MSLGNRRENIKTHDLLKQCNLILGTNKNTFWPFLEHQDTVIRPYGDLAAFLDLNSRDATATVALEDEFIPQLMTGGIHSYYINATNSNHLSGNDNARFTFGDGTIDEAFSLGIWMWGREFGGDLSLISKYRTDATAAREWDFRWDSSNGTVDMELFDDSATASEILTSDTALDSQTWYCLTMTYDGAQAAPAVNIYVDGANDGGPTTTETGAYVALEDLTQPIAVGARNVNSNPTQEFEGYLALPFITGKELSAIEVNELYNIGRTLMGI